MKWLSLLLALGSSLVNAQLGMPPNAAEKAYLTAPNMLSNPGFEQGKTGWTASGGTYTVTSSTSNVGTGKQSGDWDSNAAAQVFASAAVTSNAGQGFNGQPFVGACRIKAASGTPTHTIQLYDGTNTYTQTIVTTTTGYTMNVTPVFTFPTTGSTTLQLRIVSVASNEPEIFIDDCILVNAQFFNLSQVSQAAAYGSLSQDGASSCNYSENTSSGENDWVTLGSGSGCNAWTATGSITNSTANSLQAVASNMPDGQYMVVITGRPSVSNAQACNYTISDGTTRAGSIKVFANTQTYGGTIVGYFSYSSLGNRTFVIQAADSGVTTCTFENGTTGYNIQWSFYRFPSSSQTAYRPDQTPASWSGYLNGSGGGWSTTSSTYADLSVATTSTTLTELQNRNMGSVIAEATKLPGITFTPPRVGMYLICSYITTQNSTSGQSNFAKITDGSNNEITGGEAGTAPGNNTLVPLTLCGTKNFTSISSQTIKIRMKTAGGTANINQSTDNPIGFSIVELDSTLSTPFLLNGYVTTNSSGQRRIESASIANNGTCSITRQSGSWISSVSHPGTGACILNFSANEFSGNIECTCTIGPGHGSGTCTLGTDPTSSSVEVDQKDMATNTFTDFPFYIICNGPR